ncbi:MAG: LysR family transcriptional regulator [Clostridia bacterium]|nr:LysR family transcriptional regulator [Clostridia bacterium]
MTLQQIFYALTISQMGSMNKAAEALFLSQPSLTSAIKELESEAGIHIFHRTSKGVSETNEGAEFLMYARQVYQQYELLTQKYGEKGNLKRKFNVSTQHYSFAVKAFVETVKQYDTSKYEFAVRETKTLDVIRDVGTFKSEIGILYLSDFNRKIISKFLREHDLQFHPLIECQAYVYIWKKHPLATKKSINLTDLDEYPCLSFEQGDNSSFYFAEEILSENIYKRTIKACDRATMLNLMIGLNGYTLCSGIICEELNGCEYVAVPFEDDEINQNSIMEIGYVTKKNSMLSEIGKMYIEEVKKYIQKA